MANFEKVAEVDVYGKLGRDTCFNNPYACAFISSMVSDWVTNNDIDGLMPILAVSIFAAHLSTVFASIA
jgi:hypothetical protein